MILSQVYHTNRKFMSDGNLNKWKAYESLENVPVPEEMDFSPAPIRVQDFFFESFNEESATKLATKLGWCIGDDWKGTVLYIPVRRFCFLEDGATPSPTIRYYMSGDWLTAKEVRYRLEQL